MLLNGYRCLGKITKIHGYDGEVFLVTDSIFPKKIEKTEWVFFILEGLPVPFFVSSIKLRSETIALLKLDDIHNSDGILKYIGMDVYIEEKTKHSTRKQTAAPDINGYTVIDTNHGTLGIAKTVINYSDNYLLQVYKGKQEILIPVNDEIIGEINDKTKTIQVTTPEGLMDLYISEQ
jgi:16S rRNA processing protein RimM